MTPSLKNLQYLIALNKTNHFGKAASECFVSPSTFSAGISKLERDLNLLLVERDNKIIAWYVRLFHINPFFSIKNF